MINTIIPSKILVMQVGATYVFNEKLCNGFCMFLTYLCLVISHSIACMTMCVNLLLLLLVIVNTSWFYARTSPPPRTQQHATLYHYNLNCTTLPPYIIAFYFPFATQDLFWQYGPYILGIYHHFFTKILNEWTNTNTHAIVTTL